MKRIGISLGMLALMALCVGQTRPATQPATLADAKQKIATQEKQIAELQKEIAELRGGRGAAPNKQAIAKAIKEKHLEVGMTKEEADKALNAFGSVNQQNEDSSQVVLWVITSGDLSRNIPLQEVGRVYGTFRNKLLVAWENH